MKRPIITLLTDFGLVDHYVAAMKGVMLGICPTAELVDISHEITPFSIPEGAYTLAQAWQCFPKGTVHLGVVDPGVGTSRRAIIVETGGHFFVLPDNGLITLVQKMSPGRKIIHISNERFFRKPVSNTFHGRDIFAPVAAHLAKGVATSRFGPVLPGAVLGEFENPKPIGAGKWGGVVLKIDRFGNVITNLDWNTCGWIATQPFLLKVGKSAVKRFSDTYGSVRAGQLFVLKGSSGYVEISLNQSSAAARLGVVSGSSVELQIW